jgi:hypothetical protein
MNVNPGLCIRRVRKIVTKRWITVMTIKVPTHFTNYMVINPGLRYKSPFTGWVPHCRKPRVCETCCRCSLLMLKLESWAPTTSSMQPSGGAKMSLSVGKWWLTSWKFGVPHFQTTQICKRYSIWFNALFVLQISSILWPTQFLLQS